MSDPWDDLGLLYSHLWTRLATGAAQSRDPFRLTVLATTGTGGPEARMVALRVADGDRAEVEIHSDLRTAKVDALRADSRAALLFWDPRTQIQIRLSARLSVNVADPERWTSIPDAARGNYGTDPAPGTPIAASDAYERTPRRARFAALRGAVYRIDAVSLGHDPHRRAVFDGPQMRGRWVAP